MISGYSASTNCIDVSKQDGKIVIIETDQLNRPKVVTTCSNFAAFILGVKAGQFDFLVKEELAQLKDRAPVSA